MPYHKEQAKCREVEVEEGGEVLLSMEHEPLKPPVPFALHGMTCQCGHKREAHCQCGASCTACAECLGFTQDVDNGVDEEEREPTLG